MIRVSLIESLTEVRRSIQRLLKKEPQIQYCGIFKDYSEYERSDRAEETEILILDVQLLNEVPVQKIKKEQEHLLMLIYSVFDHDEQLLESLKKGANGYVLKRGSGRSLLEGILNIREKKADMSPGLAKKIKESLEASFESSPSMKKKWSSEKWNIIHLISEGQSVSRVAKNMDCPKQQVQQQIFEIYKQLSD